MTESAPGGELPRGVELRVHGVSGTPPAELLDCARVVQVAGDESSSFWRRADDRGREVPPASGDPELIEAYHWGKFTSGSWRQGLWLALLPFGLVNAAQFMLPRPGAAPTAATFAGPRPALARSVRTAASWHTVAGAMLRLLGLALTGMLLVATAVVLLDLVAWQWTPSRPGLAWGAVPGWPSALALLVCAGVLLVLSALGRDGSRAVPAAAPEGAKGAPEVPPTDLGRASFFRGDPDAPQLRRLHVAAGLSLLALIGLAAARGPGAGLARSLGGLWLGLLVLVTVFLGDPERGARGLATGRASELRRWWHERALPPVTGPAVAASTTFLLAVTVLTARRPHTALEARRAVPGVDGAAFGVLLVCVGALVVLGLACAALARRTRRTGAPGVPAPFQRFAAGMTTALVAALGVFLGVGYSAALGYGAARALDSGPGPTVEVPPLLQRVAYAWGLTVVLMVGIAAVLGLGYLRRRRSLAVRARAAFTFGDRPGCRLPERWLPRVAAAMYKARLKNVLEPVVWLLAVTGLVLSLAAGLEYLLSRDLPGGCRTRDLPGPLTYLSEAERCGGPDLVIALGTLTLLGLALTLVLLGRGALRRPALRRGVNVVWDVIAFWPRAAHPFVPPAYSQLAVPDLRRRIRWHLGTGPPQDGVNPDPVPHVVVAAHSQGSLIALSALLWLSAEERRRVGFLSFGSQLQVQFPRAFPAFVDIEVLRWIFAGLDGRWLNLYRDTDAIAGPVLSWGHSPDRADAAPTSCRLDTGEAVLVDDTDPVTGRRVCGPEWRLLDPSPSDPALQTGPVAQVRGHSDYFADPDWARAVGTVRPPRPAPGVPALSPPGSAGDEQRHGVVLQEVPDPYPSAVDLGAGQLLGPEPVG